MSYPSNARGSESLYLGLIAQVEEIPMAHAPDQAAAFRDWLGAGGNAAAYAGLTTKTDAYAATYLVRVNGDRIGILVATPTNPDTPDLTDPANAPADDDNNPDLAGHVHP